MKVLWAADECGIKYERADVGGAFGGNDQNRGTSTMKSQRRRADHRRWRARDLGEQLGRALSRGQVCRRHAVAQRSRPEERGRPLDGLAAQRRSQRAWRIVLLGADPHAARQARHGGDQEGGRGCRPAVRPARRLAGRPALRRGASISPWATSRSDASSTAWYALDIERPELKNVRAPGTSGSATRPAYAKHIMVKLT